MNKKFKITFFVFLFSMLLIPAVLAGFEAKITPANPTTNDDLTCHSYYDGIEIEGQGYEEHWFRNSVEVEKLIGKRTISSENTRADDTFQCSIYNDGIAKATSQKVIIRGSGGSQPEELDVDLRVNGGKTDVVEVEEEVTFTCSANGGSGNYDYEITIDHIGTISNSNTATYTFQENQAGRIHRAHCYATDSNNAGLNGQDAVLVEVSEEGDGPQPPEGFQAILNVNPDEGEVPLSTDITCTATEPADLYRLDLGNGAPLLVSNQPIRVENTYYGVGNYEVLCNALIWGEAEDEATHRVRVYEPEPEELDVELTADDVTPEPGREVNFECTANGGSGNYDYEITIDGVGTISNTDTAAYTFEDEGLYTARCDVVDQEDTDLQGFDELTLNVQEGVEPGEFSVNILADRDNENCFTYHFDSEIQGGIPGYAYSWNFGDGIFSTEATPTKTYDEARMYLVELEVTDSEGSVATDTRWVSPHECDDDDDDDDDVEYDEDDYGLEIVGITYDEPLQMGYDARIGVSVKNTGIVEAEEVKVTVLLMDEGIFSTTSRFEVDPEDVKSTSVMLEVPETWQGFHTLRIVASNDYVKDVKHREVLITT